MPLLKVPGRTDLWPGVLTGTPLDITQQRAQQAAREAAQQRTPVLGGADPRTQPPLPPQGPLAAPSIATSDVWDKQRYRASPAARQAFEEHVGHEPGRWLRQYLSPYHVPEDTLLTVGDNPRYGKALRFETRFEHPKTGDYMGDMERMLYPEAGIAKHDYLSLDRRHQGKGIGRRILNDQVDAYRTMRSPIDRIDLLAALEGGGYTWAQRGFLPHHSDVPGLERDIDERLRGLEDDGDITPEQIGEMNRILDKHHGDARLVHAILRHPALKEEITASDPYGERTTQSIAKHLLRNQTYHASLDLRNPYQMEMFNRTRGD